MKLYRFVAILILFACALMGVCAAVPSDYSALRKSAEKLSLEQILQKGKQLNQEGNVDAAIAVMTVGTERYNPSMQEKEKQLCVELFERLGNIQNHQCNYPEALRQLLRALDIAEECESGHLIMEIYNGIGLAYCGFDDYETGLRFLRKGYSLRNQYPNRRSESNLLLNMTGYSCEAGRPADARKYMKEARKIISPDDSLRQYMLIYNEGYIKATEKRYAEACSLLRRAAGYLSSPMRKCYAYDRLYLTFRDWGKTDSMFHYLKKTYELAKECDLRNEQLQTLRHLSDYYRDRDPLKSMEYARECLKLIDTVFNKRDFYAVNNIRYMKEAEQHNRRVAEMEMKRAVDREQIRVQRFIIVGVIVLLLSAGVFVTILIRQKRALATSYADLFRQSKNLIRQEEESRREMKRYETEIRELRSRVAESQAGDSPAEAETVQTKYSRSPLSDTSKQKIESGIKQIVNDTEEIYAPDFSLNKLSQLVGSNNQYVSQIINEVYGKNFNDFTNELRVRRACAYLLDTERYGNYSVRGIAEMVGFRSESTFFRAFRKFVGFSPVVYQKMALKEGAGTPDL